MKKLIFGLLCLSLIACSTVHKTITSTKKVEDSVTVATKDTTNVLTQVKRDDDFAAHGIDITLNYADTTAPQVNDSSTTILVPAQKGSDNSTDQDEYIQDIVKNALTGLPSTSQLPSSITIHIDSLSNTSATSVIKDSVNVKSKDTTNVKTNTTSKDKVVTKTGLSIWVYVGLGVVVIILLVVLAVKLGFKFL